MRRKVLLLLLIPILVLTGVNGQSHAATSCTVVYYYTSGDNPESVPKATKGTQSGTEWNIKPTGPLKKKYTKTINGKTVEYSFDGWYTNINCVGKRYLPGTTTTAIEPRQSGGKYTVSLYGRWICSEAPGGPGASGTSVRDTRPTTSATTTASTAVRKKDQTILSICSYTFSDKGQNYSIKAKASSGLPVKYSSSKPEIVSVDSKGVMKAKKPGKAIVTVVQKGNAKYKSAKATINVAVPSFASREKAMAPWKHILIDTFFRINGRAYSRKGSGKYWKNSEGVWSGRTGRSGSTQSCVTLPNISLKRMGIVSVNSGCIWFRSNSGRSPNGTVRHLKKSSRKVSITYPHKSLKALAASGGIKYGDIVCRTGHTFVYMGNDKNGAPLIYESGTPRDIGGGTRVVWGHNSKGKAHRLTKNIKKQISKSDTQGRKWEKGEISDNAFNGHKASGKNLNNAVHIVCSIKTFRVLTNCVNGTISPGNTYMAGQNVTVKFSPAKGHVIDYIEVDGKKQDISKHSKSFAFENLKSDHSIKVVYK